MELSVFKRDGIKKSETKQIRLKGGVPAVIYGGASGGESIYVSRAEFATILRTVPKGKLATRVIDLKGKGSAIVKEIQYHPTTYEILHIDFELLGKKQIRVNVPITIIGERDCNGLKLGGILRLVIRSVKVRCLPEHLPGEFVVDVADMSIGGAKRLSDIEMPKNVVPLASLGQVAVVIAKR